MQEALAAERAVQTCDDLALFLEHEPIVTLGRNWDGPLGDLRTASSERAPIPVLRVDRGGGPTYHGPGQLVVYPVVALRSAGRGVRDFVGALELALCDVARDLGVAASTRAAQPGAWVRRGDRDRKLGSVGLAVRRGVTLHGAALNVSRASEEGFRGFAPCGIAGAVATSLEGELRGAAPSLPALAGRLAGALAGRSGFASLHALDPSALAAGTPCAAGLASLREDEVSPWS